MNELNIPIDVIGGTSAGAIIASQIALGYSLNAFIDFDHPLDIFSHLLVGSEGTLAFLSEVTLKAVPDPPYKTTGLALFKSVDTAMQTLPIFINEGADAVE